MVPFYSRKYIGANQIFVVGSFIELIDRNGEYCQCFKIIIFLFIRDTDFDIGYNSTTFKYIFSLPYQKVQKKRIITYVFLFQVT